MFERIRHVPAELDVGDRAVVIAKHRAVLGHPAAQISERSDFSTCPGRLRPHDDFREVMQINRRGTSFAQRIISRALQSSVIPGVSSLGQARLRTEIGLPCRYHNLVEVFVPRQLHRLAPESARALWSVSQPMNAAAHANFDDRGNSNECA
jgi:hypothetical protein